MASDRSAFHASGLVTWAYTEQERGGLFHSHVTVSSDVTGRGQGWNPELPWQ